jgi:hypothetical protein
VNSIQETINSIKLPHIVNRKYFNLKEYSTWKASELRTFYLYMAVPCLIGKLNYKCFIHLCCLINAVRMLHYMERGDDDIKDSILLMDLFKQDLKEYYGENTLTQNMHILLNHFIHDARKHGSHSQHSMFSFESSLGYYKRSLHGNRGLHSQFMSG